jgi:Kinetochore protein CHL4 like
MLPQHYFLTRVEGLPLTVLRIRLQDTPYNSNAVLLGVSRSHLAADDGSTVFIGFPDGTPMIYVTTTSKQFGEERSLRKVVLDVRLFILFFQDETAATHAYIRAEYNRQSRRLYHVLTRVTLYHTHPYLLAHYKHSYFYVGRDAEALLVEVGVSSSKEV